MINYHHHITYGITTITTTSIMFILIRRLRETLLSLSRSLGDFAEVLNAPDVLQLLSSYRWENNHQVGMIVIRIIISGVNKNNNQVGMKIISGPGFPHQ